jgi:pimeloyl-ACP methyl ester carboxylesterase
MAIAKPSLLTINMNASHIYHCDITISHKLCSSRGSIRPRCVSLSHHSDMARSWAWKISENVDANIRYRHMHGSGFDDGSDSRPKALLMHGFGVGGWHYERNLPALSSAGLSVYAMDILGQGDSWPNSTPTNDDELFISIDLWGRQILEFAQEVMKASPEKPIYIVGNSLGGFLAVQFAAQHPSLVKGIVLLNATPFWSFLPPIQDAHGNPTPRKKRQGIWSLLPDRFGSLPVPDILKTLIKAYWWDVLRKPETIRNLLGLVYSHKGAVTDRDVDRIIKATDQPLALDVFAAIALSPSSRLDFNQALEIINRNGTPCLMLYGREDPWVVPIWGARLKRRVKNAVYLELSPCGHCPANEVPNAVNEATAEWIVSGGFTNAPWSLGLGATREIREEDGRIIKLTNLGLGERLAGDTAPVNTISRFVTWLDSLMGL